MLELNARYESKVVEATAVSMLLLSSHLGFGTK